MLRLRRAGGAVVAAAAAAAVLMIPQAQANHIEAAGGGFAHDNTIPAGYGTSNTCNVNDVCFIGVNTSNGDNATGLFGRHSATAGGGTGYHAAGVVGVTDSQASGAVGVYGKIAPNGQPGSGGAAVRGDVIAAGNGYADTSGVYGYNGGIGYGLRGFSQYGTGIYGESAAVAGTGVWGYGLSQGVFGSSGGVGVVGSGSVYGVRGNSGSNSADAAGVYGTITSSAANAAGVRGYNGSTQCCGMGVAGFHAGQGIGVYGEAPNGFAISGFSPNNWSGYFQGSVNVVGTLYKSSGAFRIDNPLDPAHSYLQHSFVESPDMKNIYDGVVRTDGKGFATVKLPRWFGVLNKDFRYQLTILGHAPWDTQARLWDEIANNRFTIRTNRPRIKVSWQVTGIRQDAYAKAHRIQTILPKRGAADGKYVHPELYGKPLSKSVVVLPGMTAVAQPKLARGSRQR